MPSIGSVFATFGAKDNLTPQLKKMQGSLGNFDKRMKASSAGFAKFGANATAAGKKMTMGLTAPIVGLGVASFKMASDFEASMTKIQSLVGKSEAEVKSLTTSVLKLSGSTARAPQELADAMFFITSAGIDAADAAGVLEASAKAAAVGLGDTATIADLATSAMNAYGKENLSASNATDVMVAAVREGKLEASELAGSMGRVLPIASAMGVSFEEVGAAFASLSRTGTNAAEAATQVRGIMSSLLRPTKQAEEALTDMGLSSEGLREQLKEKGLLSTLKTLSEEFGDNSAAAASVFGNVRALSGVMDLMGKNVAGTEAIFANMNDTLGATNDAFAIQSQTAEFKMAQVMADFKVILTELGQTVIPIVLPMIQKVAEFVGMLAEKFSKLSGPGKTAIIIMVGLVAAAGPLLLVVGMLMTAFAGVAGGLMAILGPIGLAIAAIGLITFAIMKLNSANDDFKQKVDDATNSLVKANPEIEGATLRMQALADTIPDAVNPLDNLSEALKETAKQSLFVQHGIEEGLGDAFIHMTNLGIEFEKVIDKDIASLDKYVGSLDDSNKITEEAKFHYENLSDEGKKLATRLRILGQQGDLTKDEMRKLIDSIDDTSAAFIEAAKESEEAAKEFLDSGDAMKILTETLHMTTDNALAFTNQMNKASEGSGGARSAVAMLDRQVAALATETAFATSEFGIFAKEAKDVEIQSKKVVQTWEDLVEVADRKALYFTLALDTTGLYEQLNEAMSAIIDLGSMMPGGDSAMLDEQLAISRRISMELVGTKDADASANVAANKAANAAAKAAAKAAQAAHDAAVKESERIFDSFVSSTIGTAGTAISESFVAAMAGKPEDIKKAFKSLLDTAFKSGLTQIPEMRKVLIRALEGQKALIAIAEERAKLSKDLETAEDRLTKALENQATAQSKVNKLAGDRASLAAKTSSAFGFEFKDDLGAKAQADRLLEQYTAFEGNLKALQTKGFPADIISQVIGLGAFAGNEAATGLLAMGDTDFASFTTALAGISSIGAKIGEIQAGITFDAAQGSAAASLAGANASVEGEQAAVGSAKMLLSIAEFQQIKAGKFAGQKIAQGMQSVLAGLPDTTEKSAAALKVFNTELAAFLAGDIGAGLFDLTKNGALGSIPELLKAQEFKAVTAAVMPKGTKADPIVVTDPKVLEAVKASLTPTQKSAQAVIERQAGAAAANAAVLDMVGGAGNAYGLGDMSLIADDLFKKAMNMQTEATSLAVATATDFASLDTLDTGNYTTAMRTRGAGFAFADAGSMGMLGNGRSGVNPNAATDGLTINVAGSILSENDLIEVIRQGALRNQTSGTEWAPSASGVY
tara:strand:- start:1785 stop:5771 length:3987 start_codon:yes stop_codon:yes gene_type:complete